MKFTIDADLDTAFEFECADTIVSRWLCGQILEGKTYPYLDFVDDVQVVFDVGANCGATSVHLARHYPDAEIHAFEPGSEARAILERNARSWPNIHVHPFGLHSTDQTVPLYKGAGDTGLGSIFPRTVNLDESEPVELRVGGAWAMEQGIDRVDVLKIDVEGAEVPVLEGFVALLPTVKVLYLEYDSRDSRRTLDRMLEATHVLYMGALFMDQGECIYLRNDLADLEAATEHLREAFRDRLAP